MIAGRKITALIGGSIAAYKGAELVRELVKRQAQVNVVMSKSACEFITPLTLQTLSGNPVTVDLFDLSSESRINHIALADGADLILSAPTTANLLAKVTAGVADDAPSTVILAARCPTVFAPAMNVNMWLNPVTQRNVNTLRELGYYFVEPEVGMLACGWQGPGRFPELVDILATIESALSRKDLLGVKVTIAAGPTREPLDPIRFISNRSSGKMGFALAKMARARGAKVALISGPVNLKPPLGVDYFSVETAHEMYEKVFSLACQESSDKSEDGEKLHLIFMAAAVSDHAPAEPAAVKLKKDKTAEWNLRMIPNPDILAELGLRRESMEKLSGCKLKIVGFAAETGTDEELIESAKDKLLRKNSDLIVGNIASEAFESESNRVWLVDRSGRQEQVATADKMQIAGQIIDAALALE